MNVLEPHQLSFIVDQHENNRSLTFWRDPTHFGTIDVMMSEEVYESFRLELDEQGISHEIWITDVKELIEQQMDRKEEPLDFFDAYHTYEEIVQFLKDLQSSYPHLVTLKVLGQTYEGRDLLAAKVSSSPDLKNAIFFNGGIHAREWISPATVLYILNSLVTDYQVDPVITRLVDNLDIWVLPVFNADGYSYTWTNDRMWRKTRKPNQGSSCVGTDPNRNWDFHWGEGGASANPCSETFRGPSAFSEIEVSTVGRFIVDPANRVRGYIDFHAYSQLWMSPWGYTTAYPADYTVQNDVSARSVAALTAVYGTKYVYGTVANTIYVASGSAVDYSYGVGRIVYSYTPELRDTGSYGFLLPPAQIRPSGVETLAGWKVFAQEVLENS